ncbi:MAG: hypothetical protein GDA49_11675 [Rhodospirillales bacterium]|nr:hypothetical protein [Rhodospirillales bacterium]
MADAPGFRVPEIDWQLTGEHVLNLEWVKGIPVDERESLQASCRLCAPRDRSRELFTQACRSIGEPILGRPLNKISIARLLAQLLLLQKTMRINEGIGRALAFALKMWRYPSR